MTSSLPYVEGKKVYSVDQFEPKQEGNFLQRVDFAVIYDDDLATCYSFDFFRYKDGWRIINLSTEANIDNILSRPWPH